MNYVLTDTNINLIFKGKPILLSIGSSFNFNKLHKLLSSGNATEADIEPLLEKPANITGFFKVYQTRPHMLVHETSTGTLMFLPDIKSFSLDKNVPTLELTMLKPEFKLLGVYPNVDSIIHEYPEHFL